MPEYLELDLSADAEQLAQDARDYIADQAPAGHILDPFVDWIITAVARMAVEIIVITGRVPITIFQAFGSRILKVPVLAATTATGTVTVTAVDTLGHTLEAGAQLDVAGVGFLTTADLTIPASSSSGQVAIAAIVPGSAGSGLTGPADLVAPTYVWVDTIELDAITTGGRDGGTGEQYADRLADETPTLSPKAILIEDFEVLARRDLEVHRALAIDNYVPGDPPETDVPGAVTIALQDAAGEPVSAPAKDRVTTTLEAGRVLALEVHVIDATYTPIDVDFAATCYPGHDPAVVEAEAIAAITEALDPATHGLPPSGDRLLWVDEPIVQRNDLIGRLYAVRGLRHVTALTLAATGDPLDELDVTITGPAGLTRPGEITGTVTL